MNTVDEQNKNSKIHIVGSNRMQNELMGSFLQSSLGLACENCSPQNLEDCFDVLSDHKAIFLFDTEGADIGLLSRYFDTKAKPVHSNHLAVAYNVDPYRKMDPKIKDCCLQGVFYKNEPLENVSQGIKSILEGNSNSNESHKNIDHRGNGKKLRGELSEELTSREKDVLIRLYSGDSNQKISEDLGISFHTVKSHVYNIFRKINVKNRFQATLWTAHNVHALGITDD